MTAMLRFFWCVVVAGLLAGCAGSAQTAGNQPLRQGIDSGDYALRAGRLELAESLYATAVEQATLSGEEQRMFDAVTRHAGVVARLGRTDEALGQLDGYLAIEEPGEPKRAHVLLLAGRIALLGGDVERAAELASQVSVPADVAANTSLEVDRQLLDALVAAHLGDVGQAESILAAIEGRELTSAQVAETLRCRALIAGRRGDDLTAGEQYLAESRVHIASVRPDAVARSRAAAARHFEHLGDAATASRLLVRAAGAYSALGRTREARAWQERALSLAREAGDAQLEARVMRMIETAD
jgi:tetratricopeptide (TPR) repeat protein